MFNIKSNNLIRKQKGGFVYKPPKSMGQSNFRPVQPQVDADDQGSPYDKANNDLIASTEAQIALNNTLNGQEAGGFVKNTKNMKLKKKKISYNNIKKMGRKYSSKKISNRRKVGGGKNIPVDVRSNVPPSKQWTNPDVRAPQPQYNGGIFIGPQAYGPWGTIPVTPTTANMIHNNLRSANPPPGATVQYPGTDRLGNNFSAMPGIDWFGDTTAMNPGPFRIQGTSCPEPNQCGGKRVKKRRKSKRNNKKKSNNNNNNKKRSKKRRNKTNKKKRVKKK